MIPITISSRDNSMAGRYPPGPSRNHGSRPGRRVGTTRWRRQPTWATIMRARSSASPSSTWTGLVDTNYHHAIAWFRAFQRYDVTLPIWRIHRHIGMGGDQLVGALAGEEVEERCGDLIR